MNQDRILWNRRDHEIDEIVMHDVKTVHIEQMGDHCWCIGLYKNGVDDPYWMGNFVADDDGFMKFIEQENAGIKWHKDEEHF